MIISRPFNYLAWHKPTEKMFKVYGVSGEFVYEHTLDGIFSSPTNPANLEDCILLQYSGVFDTKGVEIYESDIIECSLGMCIVEFAKGAFWAKSLQTDRKIPLCKLFMPKRRGNYFLHPELTKL